MVFGDDAIEAAGSEGEEIQRRMVEAIADGGAIALVEQEIVDHLLDLENIDVHLQVGVALADLLDRARHHDLGDARHRSDSELRELTAADLADDVGEIIDLFIDGVDLFEDELGILCRKVAAVLAHEEADAERTLGIFDETADPWRGNVEKLGRAGDRA